MSQQESTKLGTDPLYYGWHMTESIFSFVGCLLYGLTIWLVFGWSAGRNGVPVPSYPQTLLFILLLKMLRNLIHKSKPSDYDSNLTHRQAEYIDLKFMIQALFGRHVVAPITFLIVSLLIHLLD